MDELGLTVEQIIEWFPHEQDQPYVFVRMTEEHTRALADALGVPVRRCYITDELLEERASGQSVPKSEIVAAVLPDAGSTMSGDFGEILGFLYQVAKAHPRVAIGPKKWRLKQDRTKPAPHSDVIHFVLPSWPTPSTQDILLCAEVKAKSTDSTFAPIKSAIEGSKKDRTGRLAKTLVWLKERALIEDIGAVSVRHIERFINAIDHPPHTKQFRAIAIVCSGLVAGELGDAPTQTPSDFSVVVIAVPELYKTYTDVFEAVCRSVSTPPTQANEEHQG